MYKKRNKIIKKKPRARVSKNENKKVQIYVLSLDSVFLFLRNSKMGCSEFGLLSSGSQGGGGGIYMQKNIEGYAILQ